MSTLRRFTFNAERAASFQFSKLSNDRENSTAYRSPKLGQACTYLIESKDHHSSWVWKISFHTIWKMPTPSFSLSVPIISWTNPSHSFITRESNYVNLQIFGFNCKSAQEEKCKSALEDWNHFKALSVWSAGNELFIPKWTCIKCTPWSHFSPLIKITFKHVMFKMNNERTELHKRKTTMTEHWLTKQQQAQHFK